VADNVIPLRRSISEHGEIDPHAPCTVLSLRDRLYKRFLEEALAERERESQSLDLRTLAPPRLRVVRP
jgi:hypothetical protein